MMIEVGHKYVTRNNLIAVIESHEPLFDGHPTTYSFWGRIENMKDQPGGYLHLTWTEAGRYGVSESPLDLMREYVNESIDELVNLCRDILQTEVAQ